MKFFKPSTVWSDTTCLPIERSHTHEQVCSSRHTKDLTRATQTLLPVMWSRSSKPYSRSSLYKMNYPASDATRSVSCSCQKIFNIHKHVGPDFGWRVEKWVGRVQHDTKLFTHTVDLFLNLIKLFYAAEDRNWTLNNSVCVTH